MLEELKHKVQTKKQLLSEQTDSLLTSPYINPNDVISSLFGKIHDSLTKNDQTRFFVGLVQATLSGKTRLLLEASLHHPMILISFKKGNTLYWDTLTQSLDEHKISCKNFEQRLFHNHMIILKLRIFLLSYLDFALLYKKYIIEDKKWNSVDRETKLILSALLLNGGSDLVKPFFQQRIEKLREEKLTADSDFKLIKKSINEEISTLLHELELPWFAFDECHVPQSHFQGLLFHSDYESRLNSKQSTVIFKLVLSALTLNFRK